MNALWTQLVALIAVCGLVLPPGICCGRAGVPAESPPPTSCCHASASPAADRQPAPARPVKDCCCSPEPAAPSASRPAPEPVAPASGLVPLDCLPAVEGLLQELNPAVMFAGPPRHMLLCVWRC